MSIQEIILELTSEEKTLLSSTLSGLSNLNSAELECLRQSWPAIEIKRRRQIVQRLIELAEENLELNFDCVLKYCLKDQDSEVRSQAIEGLWENEEAALIIPLIGLLEGDSSERVRIAAAIALGKFALLAEHKKLRSVYIDRIEEVLLTILNNNNESIEVRRRALEAVAPLSLPRVRKAIINAYRGDDSRLRVSSIYAMGRNCSLSWLPILIEELTSTDAEIRYEAAGACGEIEEEDSVSALVNLVNDPDIDVQMATIRALGKIGGLEAKECLKQCLDSENTAIRQAVEQALTEMESPKSSLLSTIEIYNSRL